MALLGEVIRSGGDCGNLPSQMDTATAQLHPTMAKLGCESKLPVFFFFQEKLDIWNFRLILFICKCHQQFLKKFKTL